jgi:hypothetical protein
MIKTLPLVFLALIMAAQPRTAAADCRSTWQKLGDAFQRLSPVLQLPICKIINKSDPVAAQKCVDDYLKKKAEIEDIVRTYNTGATSEKVGPRGLGFNYWYTGNLLAERLFVGPPTASDTATFNFEGTGGSGQAPFTVTICWVDLNGNQVKEPVARTFTNNSGRWNTSFSGVFDLRPMVFLKNSRISTMGHKYKLRMDVSSTEPAVVRAARVTAAQ